MAKMGRPKINIDKKIFENLCAIQCTEIEICGWFGICSDTLESWCKRTYEMNFSEVFKEKRGLGKISLRRNQFRLAEKSATMAIWLGKQYLGQKDQEEASAAVDKAKEESAKLDRLIEAIKEIK